VTQAANLLALAANPHSRRMPRGYRRQERRDRRMGCER